MALSDHTKSRLARIEAKYNPEFDMRRDGPPVTWAEMDLAEAVTELAAKVEELETKLAAKSAANMQTCPDCNGSAAQKLDDNTPDWLYPPCPTCNGLGVIE